MRFITEEDLRHQYKSQPFTTYKLEAGMKLTPGASQFLNDKKIFMEEHNSVNPVKQQPSPHGPGQMLRQKWIRCKIKTVEAEFLAAGEELLHLDVILSQKVMVLAKQFSGLQEIFLGKEGNAELPLEECPGIHEDNFHCELSDCFEITDFHIHGKRGREIAILHRLRCILREAEASVAEKYLDTGTEADDRLYHQASRRLNQTVNTLSHFICICFGGKTCQRKM